MNPARGAARHIFPVALLGLILVAQAFVPASAGDPLPEFYGLYAVDNGKLTELKEAATDWPSFGPGVRFLAFHKGVALGAGTGMYLSRMLFHRKTIDPDASPSEKILNYWYVSTNDTRNVELRTKPISGQSEMIMLVPREPLTSGAYALRSGNDSAAKFFVDKDVVLSSLKGSPDCVDRIYPGGVSGLGAIDRAVKGGGFVVQTCARTDEVGSGSPGNTAAPRESGANDSAGADGQSSGSGTLGRWIGEVKWGLAASTAVVSIVGLEQGQKAGNTLYTKSRESVPYCEGELTLSDEANGQYVFQEKIIRTQGLECPGGGVMRMSVASGGTADAAWDNPHRAGKTSFKGTLVRQ